MPKKKTGKTGKTGKTVDSLKHKKASRKNIPTAEYQTMLSPEDQKAIQIAYERRNRDIDPQLVWRGKDRQDESDLVVQTPPLFIQEKIHPKVLIDDLLKETGKRTKQDVPETPDLFADFNGLPDGDVRTEFYQHDANWANRMILGDSLQVMTSLAGHEKLRGKVQCIYLDPPYGIKFNSNFQWSTTSQTVGDKKEHISREPEQVKAFRDTWRDGIHSYLSYLRDRLTVARDLLAESGSIFVQIGDRNVHRVRAVMDEIFGDANFISLIAYRSSGGLGTTYIPGIMSYILFYAKSYDSMKFRRVFTEKDLQEQASYAFVGNFPGEHRRLTVEQRTDMETMSKNNHLFITENLNSAGRTETCVFPFTFNGIEYSPTQGKSWRTNPTGLKRLSYADRVVSPGRNLRFKVYLDDYPAKELTEVWMDAQGASDKLYVVQTAEKIIQRCILMATDPGDLVLDPTCGAGTTAYIAEQWGRRWITIDTSRVALALARSRIMGARYRYYLLADSPAGKQKEAELTQRPPSDDPTCGDIRQGFVYDRVPHISLRDIANNAEIDVIWKRRQPKVEDALTALNAALCKQPPQPFTVEAGARKGRKIDFTEPSNITPPPPPHPPARLPSGETAPLNGLLEWEVPREAPEGWSEAACKALEKFWQARIARQKEINVSIASKAKHEYLYDKPYEDNKKVRVAGPFTVESLLPHRMLGVDENDDLIDDSGREISGYGERQNFAGMILENLKTAGVQQAHKEDRISFTSLIHWPGRYVCAEGRYEKGKSSKRAAIFIGPEFGTVVRSDLVTAAREAAEANFDVLVACAFNYDAHVTEFSKLGRVPVLKARMNTDLHMANDLKNTGKGNLFVIFGEPDIDILDAEDGQIQVKIKGVEVFDPSTGAVRSDGPEGVACWFVDTDYNEESFFVRQAYFLQGVKDPYKALKTTLKAEIDEEAWASLRRETSRPFERPESGKIAVKVINHLGDEVMKVFKV